MSTLGRKAMKKTLEQLKKDAAGDAKRYLQMREKSKKIIDIVYSANVAIASLITYVQALERYALELDEAWDRLLKSVEETEQKKPTQKKPSYRI